MTTPACPRCGAPLIDFGGVPTCPARKADGTRCGYGIDAQPAPAPARVSAGLSAGARETAARALAWMYAHECSTESGPAIEDALAEIEAMS